MAQNKFVKFSVIIFVIGSLILLFGKGKWFPDFYNPQFMGIIGLISAILIVLPSLIFTPSTSSWQAPKQKALNLLQNVLVISLLLSAAGALGLFQLYKVGFEYDKILHFIIPSLFIIVITYFNYHWYGISFRKSLIIALILVTISGFLWELFELFGDKNFGTQMLGYYGEFVSEDTFWDLIMNTLGSIVGVIIAIMKIK